MAYVEALQKGDMVEGKSLGKFARIFAVEKDKVTEGLSKSFVASRLIAVACFRLLVLEPHPMKPGFAFVKSNRSLENVVRIRFHNSNPSLVSIFVKPKEGEMPSEEGETEEKLVEKTFRFKNPSQFIRVLQYACAVFNKKKTREQSRGQGTAAGEDGDGLAQGEVQSEGPKEHATKEEDVEAAVVEKDEEHQAED